MHEFRRFSKRFTASAQKESAAIFDLYSHLLNDARLKRELFAEIDKGAVAEWAVKKVVEEFAAQFASLQDTYLRERGSDLTCARSAVWYSISTTQFRAIPSGLNALFWWPTN